MFDIYPLGDSAFQLNFGNSISETTHRKLFTYLKVLEGKNIEGVVEVVPSYTNLVIHYNPLQVNYKNLLSKLRDIGESLTEQVSVEYEIVRVPVLYGKPFGEDIDNVIQHAGLSEDEIIQKHSSQKYLVYMLGFTPGFCYLGGMDKRLATPRKEIPNQKILAGSVGIAGEQTGIYPIESPGGWQIIGRTPIKLFNPVSDKPFLAEMGNKLEFYAITEEEYFKLNEHDDGQD